jgi:hypothetical protein
MPQFKSSRLKIERANKHIADAESRINGLMQSVTGTIEIDPATRQESVKHDFGDRQAFLDIALMFGDAIHNLMCALDHVWMYTLESLAPQAISHHTKFPVRQTAQDVKGVLHRAQIDAIAPDLAHFVLTKIKPYEGGNFAIWPVHDLDIRDKHILTVPVFANASIVGILVEDYTGEIFTGQTWTTTINPPYIVIWESGLHIKDKGKLSAEIVFDNGTPFDFPQVPETLTLYSGIILKVVEAFEAFVQTALGNP